MEHFKKHWGFYLIILGVFIYLAYTKNWFGVFDKTVKVGSGFEPTENDKDCNPSSSRSGSRTELCTKPIYQVVGGAKERAFTLESNDYPFDYCVGQGEASGDKGVITDRNGKKWFFNYQVASKCLYIDNKSYPF